MNVPGTVSGWCCSRSRRVAVQATAVMSGTLAERVLELPAPCRQQGDVVLRLVARPSAASHVLAGHDTDQHGWQSPGKTRSVELVIWTGRRLEAERRRSRMRSSGPS